MELLQKFRRHCAAQRLLKPQDRLLLAVSGGVDSCVLLDLFERIKNEWSLQLAVGHVNHQLRGNESNEDEAFVKALAEKLGIPFWVERVETATHARMQKLSLEVAARELRYRALKKICENLQARAIVTAHTLDDQAETILDHILRGCGLAGLRGMASCSELLLQSPSNSRLEVCATILRPLLPFTRAELEIYARSRQLQWREDRTNADTQFRRNRIRHDLLPLLKTRFNPQIAQSLERLASIAASAEIYFRAEAEARLSEVVKVRRPDKIILDLELFWKYFSIIQSNVIRAVIRRLADQPVEPTFVETSRILALLQKSDRTPVPGKRFIWRRQIEVSIDHDGAVFQKQKTSGKQQKTSREAASFSAEVNIGARCRIPNTGMALLIERKELPRDWREQVNPNSQFVDAEKAPGKLRVRFPRPGDRFAPLRADDDAGNGRGTKKLSDFFTDLKVPRHRRPVAPILEGGDIIWICGYRIDNRFKITRKTRAVLHLQLFPEE